jgi:hypothetical protein
MVPLYCPFFFTENHMRYYWIIPYFFNKSLNDTAELLRVVQRLNLKEQCIDLTLHFITLCTLRSTVSGTRAQNHLRSIGGLEILLDGLGLPSSKFSVLRQSSISRNERCIFAAPWFTIIYYFVLSFPFLFLMHRIANLLHKLEDKYWPMIFCIEQNLFLLNTWS